MKSIKNTELCTEQQLIATDKLILSKEISNANGAEVLSVAICHDDGCWTDIKILARGTSSSAPAILRGLVPGNILLHNHPSGNLQPSDADMQVASLCGQSGIGFAIHNNECSEFYVVVEPFVEGVPEKLDENELRSFISEGGELSNAIVGFEERRGQKDLMTSVISGLNRPCHAIIEGETGIGKSMAYLIPAIYYAKNHKTRVVVSTNTINLQYQLFSKDLPMLEKILPIDFKYTLVKGRSNYICLRKVYDYQASSDENFLLELEELEQFRNLSEWIEKTNDGSKTDLNWVPLDSLWEKVNCDKDSCLGMNCPENQSCFFYISRRRAAQSDLLVANHHLVFSDLAMRASSNQYSQTAVLPSYKALILDEAHNLEGAATSHFGFRTGAIGFQQILSKLYHKRGKKEKGTIYRLLCLISFGNGPFDDQERADIIHEIKSNIIPARTELADDGRILFDLISDFTVDLNDMRLGEKRIRIKPEHEQSSEFQAIIDTALRLRKLCQNFAKMIKKLRTSLTDSLSNDENADDFALPLVELGSYSRRIEEICLSIAQLFDLNAEDRDSYVHFFLVAVRRRAMYPSFHSMPIKVADVLQDKCFSKISSVIMLSGTMTTKKNFNFIKGRLGLDSKEIVPKPISAMFKSPFNYKKQGALFLPTDFPEPNSSFYIESICDPIFEIVKSSNGGVLVLCTSYSHLNQLYDELIYPLSDEGYEVLKQGEMERHHLLEAFKDDGNAILFATDSFWEGVDIPGNALRNLIIVKLPFAAPNDPVIEARQEQIKLDGGNPFTDYQLPMAAIKLKQGFGRLIRKKTDRGAIWIFDKRVTSKWYGRYFVSSLPDIPCYAGPFTKLISKSDQFFLDYKS